MVSATDVLLDGFTRIQESAAALLAEVSPAEAADRWDGRANSIAWLTWHTTRMMDAQVAQLAGVPELVGDYHDRLGVDLPAADTGYGHDDAKVAAVGSVHLAVLAQYHDAVQVVVRGYLAEDPDLDRIIDRTWDPPVTAAARLVSIVDDAARHLGQAEYLLGALRRR